VRAVGEDESGGVEWVRAGRGGVGEVRRLT